MADKHDSFETPFDRENEFAHCFGIDDIYENISINKISSVEEAVDSLNSYYIVSEDESGGATYAFLIGEKVDGAIYMQISNSSEYIGTAHEGCCDTLYFYEPRTLYGTIKDEPLFGLWNEKNFSKLYQVLSDVVMNDQSYGFNSIKGKIRLEKDGLLYLSMPNLPGFSAYVDGKECNIISYMDGVGIDLSKGDHIIELKYTPKGMWLGIIISVVFALGFFGYNVFMYCRGKHTS